MATGSVLKQLRRRSTKLLVSPADLAAFFEAPSLASSQRHRAYTSSRNGTRSGGGAKSSIPSSEPSLARSAPHCRPRKNGFLAWYLGMLEARPLVTKCVTSSLIYAASDLTSQMVTLPPSGSLDLIRTLRMTAYGLVILGPSQHMWFNSASRVLPQRDVVTTLKKIFMGQAIYGPCITTVFFSYNAGLQGETFGDIVGRLRRDLLPTIRNGVLFWPICDFFTFKFIPVHLQGTH
ncbi:protein sym-1-like isoform X2 [Rhodamnia argentea]|uniref:Protein sym-1-like isoform X2 n=1 Tax=Rhodamnia argentea TaxID=178133 RepID=A0A8B8P1I7_9MYRT|nr:protein sym-1-like isoform X2 [Rhodamnia argentea]